ncbi:MAG: protein-disulfide reductase DsbD domain-containing protein, partial [Marinomonas sp.]
MIDARTLRKTRAAISAWLIACTALMMAALLIAAPADAQDTPQEVQFGDENIGVELYAETMPVAGKEWMLALRFTPDPDSDEEWHGYWSNPGDAGLGMQLELNLPEGWNQGEALYPVPQRFVQEIGEGRSLMNHIYKGAYSVLIPVKIPADADVSGLGSLTGFVNFLACTDMLCVPQDALLIAKPPTQSPSQFLKWRAQIAP